VEYNLFALKRQLELATGRAYSWRAISKATGLNPNTIYGMAYNKNQGIRLDTMKALLDFFNREGLQIGPGDLFTVKPPTPEGSNP
jgi:DNA-binding Xre family transcriptional regulator